MEQTGRSVPPKKTDGDLLQGTLDMLVLQTVLLGPAHGHAIAYAIERRSDELLQVEHGSLHPVLYRLKGRIWIAPFFGLSGHNRKAPYYRLTAAGRRRLDKETSRRERLARGVARVLRPAEE